MASNVENAIWNDLYDGKRVPINDTDTNGAPFALMGIGDWADGSVNKAVVETWLANGGEFAEEDLEDALAYKLDFDRLKPYVILDMLYGYKGQSKGLEPTSTMDYRGYPTIDSINPIINILYDWSPAHYTMDGKATNGGRYIILRALAKLRVSPSAPIYGVLSWWDNNNPDGKQTYEVKIEPGFKEFSHYRLPNEDTSVEDNKWIATANGNLFLSVSTEGQTVDVIPITVEFSQLGSTSVITEHYSVLENYSTPVSPEAKHLGTVRLLESIGNPDCFVSTCSEISSEHLRTKTSGVSLFRKPTTDFRVGDYIYTNNLLTNKAEEGIYWWVDHSYEDVEFETDEDVFRILKVVSIDNKGRITSIKDTPIGWMGRDCWSRTPCESETPTRSLR